MPQNQEQQPQNNLVIAFIDYLEGLVTRKDPLAVGALASMRRGLGKDPASAMDMHRYLAPWLGQSSGWDEQVYYLTASCFATWYQGQNSVANHSPKNLGASLAAMASLKPDAASGLERRFTAMLKSHRDDLPVHLRHVVSLLKSTGIPIDWRRLWMDLRFWDHPNGRTQSNWAKSFWRRQPETESEPQAEKNQ